ERILGPFAVANVDGNALVADADGLSIVQFGVSLHRGGVGRGQALQHVEVAGTQVGEAHGGVGDGQEDDPVEVVGVGVPVIRELLQYDSVLLNALDELVGSGADRLSP